MKILLLGKGGQLGWELQRSLSVLGEVVALGREGDAASGLHGDLSRPDELPATVRRVAPDVIVNAAAYTAVDKAENEAGLAMRVNGEAPGVLAEAAQAQDAWLVHFSTDYVFDGGGHRAWQESDAAAPLNVYGASKREGELLVAARCARHLVFRTSWVYSARGGNFARTMLRLAAERDTLQVVDDQVGAPTGADLLADVTAHALRRALSDPSLAGTYHAAASGETSWNGYARFVIGQALEAGVSLKASESSVERVSSEFFRTAAKRPCNSRLDTTALREAFALTMPHWQVGVKRLLDEILPPSEHS